MREIKFRAWEINEHCMLYNAQDHNKNEYESWFGYLENPESFILMQFTGLKDKNGKEIYEGDICKIIPKEEHKNDLQMVGIREVVYCSDNATFYYNEFIPMSWGGFESVEIIGNIHESPELLTQK